MGDRCGDVVLNRISSQTTCLQMLFSMLEIQEVFRVYSNVFTPGSNYITWQYLKLILANNIYTIYHGTLELLYFIFILFLR